MATYGWREITSQTERWKKEELRGNPNILSERINWEGKRKRKTKQVRLNGDDFTWPGHMLTIPGSFLLGGEGLGFFLLCQFPGRQGQDRKLDFGDMSHLFSFTVKKSIYLIKFPLSLVFFSLERIFSSVFFLSQDVS